jgi:hypothetical protein
MTDLRRHFRHSVEIKLYHYRLPGIRWCRILRPIRDFREIVGFYESQGASESECSSADESDPLGMGHI